MHETWPVESKQKLFKNLEMGDARADEIDSESCNAQLKSPDVFPTLYGKS